MSYFNHSSQWYVIFFQLMNPQNNPLYKNSISEKSLENYYNFRCILPGLRFHHVVDDEDGLLHRYSERERWDGWTSHFYPLLRDYRQCLWWPERHRCGRHDWSASSLRLPPDVPVGGCRNYIEVHRWQNKVSHSSF